MLQYTVLASLPEPPGVDDELATEVVPSINLTNTTHHNTSQHIHSVVLATRDGIMRSQLENKSRRHKSAFGAVVKSTNPCDVFCVQSKVLLHSSNLVDYSEYRKQLVPDRDCYYVKTVAKR